MNLKMILRGTGVAIVTPFKTDLSVDFDALAKLIDFIINGGVEYIVTLGTTGETPVLSKEEKLRIIDFTINHINNRVPVVVGIGGNDTAAVIKDLETYPLEKATAILSASPYYNKPSQQGLFEHYRLLAGASPKPIILYNVPGRTASNIRATTTLQLANDFKNIIGIKEASNDWQQIFWLAREKPADFYLISGNDDLIVPQISIGYDGVISVIANALPNQFSTMVHQALAGDFASAKKTVNGLQRKNLCYIKKALKQLKLSTIINY